MSIFKITENKQNKTVSYTAVPFINKYVLPDKIYGSIERQATYVWNTFARPNGRAGILCTGRAGSGKTLFCKKLCNIAVEMKIPVFVVSEIKVTIELILFISNLNNCLIFIDEYSKQFNSYQEKLLTLLSDGNKKRLFLLTENETSYVNRYILNRPERIRYHLEFDQLDSEVINEYCIDNKVPKEFKKELLRLNMVNGTFCFDHLHTIVKEAKDSNNWDINWLIEILNVKSLKGKGTYIPYKVCHKDNKNVFLRLDSTAISKGINNIKIKDKDIPSANRRNAPVLNPVLNLDNPDSNSSINTKSNPVDKIVEDKINLLSQLSKDYESVDLGTNDGPYGTNYYDKIERERNQHVKVNIDSTMLLDIDGEYNIYSDATSIYNIYVKYIKRMY